MIATKLTWPARPERRTDSMGQRHKRWIAGGYMIVKYPACWKPFVCFQRFSYFDEIDGRQIYGWRPFDERRTLRAAQAACRAHLQGVEQ